MGTDELLFLHFNDVYHISDQERIARFLAQLESYRKLYAHLNPYTTFGGDVFSPSLEASVLRGAHMLPLLRELKIDLGCYGNHDFDFGEQRLHQLASETGFPWLLSNALRNSDTVSGRPVPGAKDSDLLLAGAQNYHTATLQGFKVGFFGLAGTDWPSNCRELPHCTIHSPVETAREYSRHLRTVENCDIVVAITHMRLIEDIEVSEALCNINSPERVDLILGGHDHELLRRYSGEKGKYAHNPEYIDCSFKERDGVVRPDGLVPGARGDVRIVKSGTDWSGLSCVKLHMLRESSGKATLRSVTVEQIADMSKVALGPVELAEARARVGKCLQSVNERIDELGAEPLVHSAVSLEGTGSIIRSRESNLGNMLADMVRAYYDVDIGLVNSGSIRCNKLIRATRPPGQGPEEPLTVRDLIEILPFDNAIVVKRVGASALWDALENSFSDAHTDGRFLHYSGLAVVADWTRNEGNRVIEVQYAPDKDGTGTVIRRGDAMEFTVAMVAFIADGFDGYACFKDQETIVSEEGAVTDTQLLLRTLGYSYEQRDSPKDDAVDEDEARFTRARASIAKEMDSFGLPIIAPEIEGRITIRRLPEASLGNIASKL